MPSSEHPFISKHEYDDLLRSHIDRLPTTVLPDREGIVASLGDRKKDLRVFGDPEIDKIARFSGASFTGFEIAWLLVETLPSSSDGINEITKAIVENAMESEPPTRSSDEMMEKFLYPALVQGFIEAKLLLDAIVVDPVVSSSGHEYIDIYLDEYSPSE